MNYEAFVYIWYHGPTKRYYLGKHKGAIDDGYSHSSSVMESWDANNPPDGWRRRILFYGTDEEVIREEERLLRNRWQKGHINARYLNLAIGANHVWAEVSREKLSKSKFEFWKSKTPDERKQILSAANNSISYEQRRDHMILLNQTLPNEVVEARNKKCADIHRRRWQSLSEEDNFKERQRLGEIAKDAWNALPEQDRLARIMPMVEAAANMPREKREARSKKAAMTMGPEKRSENTRKGWLKRKITMMKHDMKTPPLEGL